MRISVEQYFGPYLEHKDAGHEQWFNATVLLEKVDKLLELAETCGVKVQPNPSTGTLVSGQKNGGFRPQSCPIGAPKSRHKQARAVDIYDPKGELGKWLLSQPEDVLADYELWFEHPKATPTWAHMQDVPPPSKRRFFYP